MGLDHECPVLEYQYARGPDPAGSNFRRLDEAQRRARPFSALMKTAVTGSSLITTSSWRRFSIPNCSRIAP